MNIDYYIYQHFFEHPLNFNQTWTSYTEYLYNELKYYYQEILPSDYERLGDVPHHQFFHYFVMDLCKKYISEFDNRKIKTDTYENISLYFMCRYYTNNPPFLLTPQRLPEETLLYPLSYQFNRDACKHIMVSIYEFINARVATSEDEQQGLYYQITNDFMDLFDKIQEDCDCMWQLGINDVLPYGCLTPHPECKSESLFFSPGIPMEYIKYLMVQKLNKDDINGYLWLKERIETAPSTGNTNSMYLDKRIIPFQKEYYHLLKRYQKGQNTMERTISSLLNFKLQVISGNNSLKIPENISSLEFIRERNDMIMNYRSIEEAQSEGAFRYLEASATSSVKISGKDGAFGTPPPREQRQTPPPKKQTTPTTAQRKAGKVGKVKTEVLFDDDNKKLPAGVYDIEMDAGLSLSPISEESEEGSSPLSPMSDDFAPISKGNAQDGRAMNFDLVRSKSMESEVSNSTVGFAGTGMESQRLFGISEESSLGIDDSDDGNVSSADSVMSIQSDGSVRGGHKRKKKTRKRLYFKDLLDAPKKGGKRKKKTRKRLYFKDLLGDNVQSGGLIPRRIYFNDLL
jgi:hypothetical protein